ncbi:MAG TPA: RNA polymerase sigma factor FliA [Gammaproteobacteria bacterium]|jgi:RNA polymerase sigma factor for flagellar operon FliA|nr:RNA polymerase sigma factor FliA [Gammaproteobacteria bacterium]
MMNSNLAAFQYQSEEDILIQHAPLVKKIALHLLAKLPDSVQLDDLTQAGLIGLLSASKSFDPTKGAKFETWAGTRIRGAMLDEVRGSDWTPRSTAKQLREVAAAILELQAKNQRPPTDREIAAQLDITLEKYHQISHEMSSAKLLSSEEISEFDGSDFGEVRSSELQPEEIAHEHDLNDILVQAIDELPEKEKLVMSLYYDEEMNLKEIGAVLEVSESRISQIHGQAVTRLRAKIDELTNA